MSGHTIYFVLVVPRDERPLLVGGGGGGILIHI